jgi:hypothetical protein
LIFVTGDRGWAASFCMWISIFPNIIYWKNCPFNVLCMCGCRCVPLLLGSILFHQSLCPFFFFSTGVWTQGLVFARQALYQPISVSIFIRIPCCFDHYSFVTYFEVR